MEHTRRNGRHLPHVPDQGRRDSRIGSSLASIGPERRVLRLFSGWIPIADTTPSLIEKGERIPTRRTTPVGLDIQHHVATIEAMRATTRAQQARGKDTISVTGNVLRDYLTDLFPHFGTWHERQNALRSCPCWQRRRHVRDGRRAAPPPDTCSSSSKRGICAGIPWANSCALVASFEDMSPVRSIILALRRASCPRALDQAIGQHSGITARRRRG